MATKPDQATVAAHHIAHHLRQIALFLGDVHDTDALRILLDPAWLDYPKEALRGQIALAIAAEALEQSHPFTPLTDEEHDELCALDMDLAADLSIGEILGEMQANRLPIDEVVEYCQSVIDGEEDDVDGD